MDFNEIDILVFDFDGVMWKFDENQEFFNTWCESFTVAMQEYLNIEDFEEAKKVNKELFLKYGSTYEGLCNVLKDKGEELPTRYEFWTKSDEYTYATGNTIKPNPVIVEMIRNIKGKKKYILSNNLIKYIEYSLDALGLNKNDFDGIVHIETDDVCKPEPEMYQKLLQKIGVDNAKRAVFFDDKDRFLKPAKELGINTVWITESDENRDYVDMKMSNILQLKDMI